MNYNFSETTFPSKDGIHTVYAEIYTPVDKAPKGIVQLAHGMIDHVGRYRALADYLAGEGYIFAGHHHLGHGKTAGRAEDFGIFAERGGIEYLLRDMHTMNKYLREKFPELPVFVLGHSMGSFISRLYTVKYPRSLQGLVIHGTSGPNPLLPFGSFLSSVISAIRGKRHKSRLINKMAFGSYNSKFPKTDGKHAWLTRDVSLVADRDTDKFTGFTFTVSGYKDLFKMIRDANSKTWFSEYPKQLPTLIMSGDMDPVGNYGKGPDYVYKQLMISGCKNVDMKIYEGARHELFNETNREEVFSDLAGWLNGIK